jgi:hypothetical protein
LEAKWEHWKTGNEAENVDEGVGEKRSEFGHDNHLRELEVFSPLDYEVYLRMSPCMFGKLTEMLHLKSDRALVDCCCQQCRQFYPTDNSGVV